MPTTDEQRVAGGYDAVYTAISDSPAFQRLWREHAMGDDFPAGFEHISFLTLPEARAFVDELRLAPGSTLVDLACGAGGPGLWVARESAADLAGIDISPVAVERARARTGAVGREQAASFSVGSFAETGLAAAVAAGAMSADALQYAPDKAAAFTEIARILAPGGRLVFVCFELDEQRVAGVPILGADPVGDYRPALEAAGFRVTRYEETPGWRDRLTAAYGAIESERDVLTRELGDAAYGALLAEVSLTLQLQPYRRRVFASAIKT